MNKIVVIGGGIAGLTAATLLHELGLQVTILEASDSLGGMAKSKRLVNGFPTEHSLRVYHETYDCLLSLLQKIPYNEQESLFQQLSPVAFGLSYAGKLYTYQPKEKSSWHRKALGLLKLLKFLYQHGLTCKDFRQLLKEEYWIRLSYARLMEKTQHLTINELLAKVSEHHLHLIHAAQQIAFVATPESAAALAIEFDTEGKPFSWFAMANGPTSERIITPWENYLLAQGVRIKKNARVTEFNNDAGRVRSVQLADGEQISADAFVCAVSNLGLTQLIKSSALQHIAEFQQIHINTEWSNGAQFYLSALPPALTADNNNFKLGTLQIHLDTPWRLVSTIQGDGLWQQVALPKNCRYILSITYTAVNVAGTLFQKSFWECTTEEIYAELLQQCKFVAQDLIIDWHLDDALLIMSATDYQRKKNFLAPHVAHQRADGNLMLNFSPLNVPTPHTFKHAPISRTPLENLYLAGDFCNTAMFVPTMEKACESGFLAAQAISEDLQLPTQIKLPFKSFNHKNHRYWRMLDAGLFTLQKKIQRWFQNLCQ